MLIRRQQLGSLSEVAASDFDERMAAHLQMHFSGECDALTPTGVRALIHYGIARCAHYGVTGERDVCKYVDLMMLFGRDFDARPDLPWAARILNDQVLTSPSARIDQLFTVAKQHLPG